MTSCDRGETLINAGVEAAPPPPPNVESGARRSWPPSEPLNLPPLCEILVSNLGGRLQSDQTSMPASVSSPRTRVGVFAQTSVCAVVSRCPRTRGETKASLSVSAGKSRAAVSVPLFYVVHFCVAFLLFFSCLTAVRIDNRIT